MDEETPTRYDWLVERANLSIFEPGPSRGGTGMPSTDKSPDEEWNDEMRERVNSARPVDEWILGIRERVNLARLVDQPRNSCTIFKVPSHIRELDDKAYDPVVVSIGPFHHTDPFSADSKRNKPLNDKPPYRRFVEDHKWRCVWHLLSRHRSRPPENQLLEHCLLELENQDSQVRSCNSEELPLNAQTLALIMLLDGCFIIYLMLMLQKKELLTTEEVILHLEEVEQLERPNVAGLFTLDLVVYDMLKLENQIPFFIIQLLFDQLKTEKDENVDLVDLAFQLFNGIDPKESESFKKSHHLSRPRDEYHHLLHIFYFSRIPALEKPLASTQVTPTFAPRSRIPRATELDKAGVKFKKNEAADGFLNITFGRRKMKIMPLLCKSR